MPFISNISKLSSTPDLPILSVLLKFNLPIPTSPISSIISASKAFKLFLDFVCVVVDLTPFSSPLGAKFSISWVVLLCAVLFLMLICCGSSSYLFTCMLIWLIVFDCFPVCSIYNLSPYSLGRILDAYHFKVSPISRSLCTCTLSLLPLYTSLLSSVILKK